MALFRNLCVIRRNCLCDVQLSTPPRNSLIFFTPLTRDEKPLISGLETPLCDHLIKCN